MNGDAQKGFSMVTVIMILLTIGLLIMTSLDRRLSAQLRINGDERRYLQLYNRALSSLNWGLAQVWPDPDGTWRCRSEVVQGETVGACLKSMANSENGLLKSGEVNDRKDDSVSFYYLVGFEAESDNDDSSDRVNLIRLGSGWLDFCPVSDRECEHDEE